MASRLGLVLLGTASLLALAAAACGRPHPDGLTIQSSGACVECHLSNYQATTAPSHVANAYPQTCNDCHTTTAWKPAFGLHPEAKFPIRTAGKHTGIQCLDCHNLSLSSDWTQNPDCTGSCHSQNQFNDNHDPGCATWSSTDHQFCRNPGCHPDGRKPQHGC